MDGVCLVISPLLALMEDQVDNLRHKNIKAVALNQAISTDETIVLFDNIQNNNIKFLYLSPEKFESALIQEKIKQLNINLIAIDEAHCVSEWGHDFRPSYLKLNKLTELIPSTPIISLTATATPKVLDDIILQLAIEAPKIFKTSFERKNLAYQFFEVEDKIFKIKQILTKIVAPTIIYVSTRNETKKIADLLSTQGFKTTYYHGGLNHQAKKEAYENWYTEKTPIIIATNAFGMGIDKPNIRVVIHMNIPNSIENYIQEAGRAGRDGKKAFAVTLLNKQDTAAFAKKIEEHSVEIGFIKNIYFSLNQFYQIPLGETPLDEFSFDINAFCSKYGYPYNKTYQALKTLSTQSIVSFSEGKQTKSTISFTTSSNRVLDYADEHPNLSKLVTHILRSYGGLFDTQGTINEYNIAKSLKTDVASIINGLIRLETDEILKYNRANNHAKIRFLVPREDNKTINRIAKNIESLEKNKAFKASAMIELIENSQKCRNKQLLTYFGENKKDTCGICDSCLEKKGILTKRNPTIQEQIITIVSKTKEISSRQLVLQLNEHHEKEVLTAIEALLEQNKIKTTPYNNYQIIK